MSAILLVDDDVVARALIRDILVEAGIPVVEYSEPLAALDWLKQQRRCSLLISDRSMPQLEGIAFAREIQIIPNAPPIVFHTSESWTELVEAASKAGVLLGGFLPKPLELSSLGRVVGLYQGAKVARSLELIGLSGSTLVYWPLLVLFWAGLQEASCMVQISRDGQTTRIGLNKGKVCLVENVPGLMLDIGLQAVELGAGIGQAVAQGLSVEQAFGAASQGLGRWLAESVVPLGHIEVSAWNAPSKSFSLSQPLSRMIAGGLKAARSPDTLAKEWSYFAGCSLELVAPPGVPESRWGLDPVSFRVVRQLAASPTIQALLQANPDPSRKLELLQALELLFWVGLVELKAPTVKISEVKVPDVPARPVAIPVDTAKLEALKAALATMEKAHPAEVLELVGRKKATEDDVANAFREISRRYHPDLFFEAAPSVRKAAEACFTRINTFHEQAKTTDGLADINRFLDAKASGKQYISEKDHISARVAFKKGEIAWKNRDWVGAEPLFEEAFRLDPVTWPHQFFRIQARVLTKKMMMPQAVKELEALAAELNPRARPAEGQPVPSALQLRFQRAGEVLAAAGMLLKQAGKEAEAKVLFVRALEVDPENRDAQREARRQEKAAREEAEGGWMGRFWKK